MVSLFGFGQQSAPTPAQDLSEPISFAEADTEFRYLNDENHHRYLAAAVCRFFIEGRSFVVVTGSADGDLIVHAINNGNQPTYRASVVQCLPDMDLGKLVRAYSVELGLSQSTAGGASKRLIVQNGSAGLKAEPESGAIWTLISYLMAEQQNGVTRILVLKDADLLDLRCFDDLQRLALLDEQHVMPVVLLSRATPSALAPFDVLRSPIVGRLATDHLESEEVGEFIQSQLATFDNASEMSVLFPPRIVETIAVASGGNAAVVNRLARKVVAAFSTRIRTSPSGSGEPRHDHVTSSAPISRPTENASATIDASHVSPERSSAAITEIEPDGVTGKNSPEDDRETVDRASDKDDGRSFDTRPTVEPVSAAVNEVASKADDQPSGTETEGMPGRSRDLHMLDVDRGGVPEPTYEIGSARDDGQYFASEIWLVEAAHDPDNQSQPALALSPGQPAADDIAMVGNVTERTEPQFNFAVAAIAISVAVALMLLLYLSAFGHWQVVLRLPRELAAQLTSKRDTHANLTPATNRGTATTVTKESRPNLPASTAPLAQRPPVQGGTPIQSNSVTNKPIRQTGDVTASGLPKVVSVQPNAPSAPQPIAPTSSAISTAPGSDAANAPSGGIVATPVTGTPGIPVASTSQVDAIMVQRGEQLLAAGDIVSARHFFERAAQTDNAAAAYGLAETYDPVFLMEIGARGVLGDSAAAVHWYQRAINDGSAKAVQRLHRLQSSISGQSVPDRGVEK